MDLRNKYYMTMAKKHPPSSSINNIILDDNNTSKIKKVFIKKNSDTISHFIPLLNMKKALDLERRKNSPPSPLTPRPSSPLKIPATTPSTPYNMSPTSSEYNLRSVILPSPSPSPVNTNTLTDIHVFDGKIKLNCDINEIKDKNRQSSYDWLINNCKMFESNPLYVNAINGINLIIKSSQLSENFSDNIYADDLLFLLSIKLQTKSIDVQKNILSLLIEQMYDCFTSGQCSIGRNSRLIMIINCIS